MCLCHVAPFIEHTDDRPVRGRVGAVLRVRNCAADCIGSCIPDWAVSHPIADEVKAFPVRARTDLVNVLLGSRGHFHPAVSVLPKLVQLAPCQPEATLFCTHGFPIGHNPILRRPTQETFSSLFRTRADSTGNSLNAGSLEKPSSPSDAVLFQ